MAIETLKPNEIETKSFEIIADNLKGIEIDEAILPVLMRVIHTSADFEYVETLKFSTDAINSVSALLKNGCTIITDTEMAKAGINKRLASKHGIDVLCYINDEEVIENARNAGATRATMAVRKAMALGKDVIYVCGNAPTALIEIDRLMKEENIAPKFVVGVPVGFVNVVESKELIMESGLEYIVSSGRKGGSNVAAAIINALLYTNFERTL